MIISGNILNFNGELLYFTILFYNIPVYISLRANNWYTCYHKIIRNNKIVHICSIHIL